MIIKDNKELKQKSFRTEKELQSFFETNLKQIMNFSFVDTEFVVGNFRIDTLAYDEETKAFKIIEFKNVKNQSLVDQGYTYLKLMLERKADFVLRYNEKKSKNLKLNDIDWSQSRVVFIAPAFTTYQLNATDFQNIPIDLIRVTKYEEDIIDIDFIKKESHARIDDIETITNQREVSREIIVYSEDDHLRKASEDMAGLYNKLKDKILELGDIDTDAKKLYIAFKGSRNIVDVQFSKTKLWVYINMKKGTLVDPLHIAQDCSSVGHWANGDYKVAIREENDIDGIIPLIKQSISINGK